MALFFNIYSTHMIIPTLQKEYNNLDNINIYLTKLKDGQ